MLEQNTAYVPSDFPKWYHRFFYVSVCGNVVVAGGGHGRVAWLQGGIDKPTRQAFTPWEAENFLPGRQLKINLRNSQTKLQVIYQASISKHTWKIPLYTGKMGMTNGDTLIILPQKQRPLEPVRTAFWRRSHDYRQSMLKKNKKIS